MKKNKKNLLVERENPVLRKKAINVEVEDILSSKISKIISKMKEALGAEADGVAIAAPQVGEGFRIFAVKGSIIPNNELDVETNDVIFINPKLTKFSQKKSKMEEGCLSLRYLYGEVLRHDKVTIEAYNEKGDYIEAHASGLLAQIFQHELDHLDGVLFIDKAENIRNIPPEATHNDA